MIRPDIYFNLILDDHNDEWYFGPQIGKKQILLRMLNQKGFYNKL